MKVKLQEKFFESSWDFKGCMESQDWELSPLFATQEKKVLKPL